MAYERLTLLFGVLGDPSQGDAGAVYHPRTRRYSRQGSVSILDGCIGWFGGVFGSMFRCFGSVFTLFGGVFSWFSAIPGKLGRFGGSLYGGGGGQLANTEHPAPVYWQGLARAPLY